MRKPLTAAASVIVFLVLGLGAAQAQIRPQPDFPTLDPCFGLLGDTEKYNACKRRQQSDAAFITCQIATSVGPGRFAYQFVSVLASQGCPASQTVEELRAAWEAQQAAAEAARRQRLLNTPCPTGQVRDVRTLSCSWLPCPSGQIRVGGVCQSIMTCPVGTVRRQEGSTVSCDPIMCPRGSTLLPSGQCQGGPKDVPDLEPVCQPIGDSGFQVCG